jgi:hypothetical protein
VFTATAGGRMIAIHGAVRPAASGTNFTQTVTDAVGVAELLRRTTVQSHDISVLISP